MKDLSLQSSIVPSGAIYKEVVVIGNGPSGIALSYQLAGNLPFYNGNAHVDEMLTARLRSAPKGISIIQQDLPFLSQGLEGRSSNPVSLLVDALLHPWADQGLNLPPLVDWQYVPEYTIDHVVLGKSMPGGAWQTMDPNIVTISLDNWMELPGMPWSKWEAEFNRNKQRNPQRTTVSQVAAYYSDYVAAMNISDYFRSETVVTSVRPINNTDEGALWKVEGYDLTTLDPFTYTCRRVVLATGASDMPNQLAVPGENSNPDWVFHDLVAFQHAVEQLSNQVVETQNGVKCIEPVAIVGAGLSAADAVLLASSWSLPIIHVFRGAGITPDRMLPEAMYPEYHKVCQMMKKSSSSVPGYTPYPEHKVLDLIDSTSGREIYLSSPQGQITTHNVTLVAVLIGSRPDLSYLPTEYQDGMKLGLNVNRPVDCRSNPILVNPWNRSVVNAEEGLYAVGPLSGDNFVRFIVGGTFAVVHGIHRKRKLERCA
ncbi:oxidative stress-induced growth inhibitor 1 [Nilaparvata lugens]|uniref:oxidative stress-induced growth inhibitor 1 n=1 Tax=Nilaparvata lugens TaxID=108931 RepID=UPI000B9989FD|nr:oxidative stress-induced growth inhibitor 1 [Nilaparvata lugens]XP_022188448.1 oxidative stress-induced growth inhibitor 1 [Nilaparvata lugens]XP_039299169.1 oxidative stress-induced growth inhibitor 1 [Nilaparvata lugens]